MSRKNAFYYGHPQNRFWPVLCAVLNVPCPESNNEKLTLCLDHDIALWDVLKSCTITGASDASIKDPVPNNLTPILSGAKIKAVFTTGKTAEMLYRKYCQNDTGIKAIGLPSPSAANAAVRFDTLVERYRIILPYLTPL